MLRSKKLDQSSYIFKSKMDQIDSNFNLFRELKTYTMDFPANENITFMNLYLHFFSTFTDYLYHNPITEEERSKNPLLWKYLFFRDYQSYSVIFKNRLFINVSFEEVKERFKELDIRYKIKDINIRRDYTELNNQVEDSDYYYSKGICQYGKPTSYLHLGPYKLNLKYIINFIFSNTKVLYTLEVSYPVVMKIKNFIFCYSDHIEQSNGLIPIEDYIKLQIKG
ncbi:MAG: hypothetical protein OEZ01_04080 [Candidatus Heimdallarchaeota archaeon]|nr:hypothetical protein [Candidatus Heimdallarchaeota archaeon]MDH5645158.1 hypothetical protein [Candidatus Heimdallarchaeota archaeon]